MAERAIYLIGFSGTGKSTVAGMVAARLGWPAYDLDRLIAEGAGVDIPALFAREGEAGFRERETAALRGLPPGPAVVATGGGAVLRPENRALMAAGWVIALEGRPERLLARLQRARAQDAPDAVRPLLDAADPLERLRALKQARQHLYALADWTVHTDRLSPEQVAAEVLRARELLQRSGAPAGAPLR